MTHYDTEAWVSYRRNEIDQNQRRLMEEHLALCNRCLQRYLAAATEQEVRLAELLLPPDFGAELKKKVGAKKPPARKEQRSRTLVNYTIAASITLCLMIGGVFERCAGGLPDILPERGQLSRTLEKATPPDGASLLKTVRVGLKRALYPKEE